MKELSEGGAFAEMVMFDLLSVSEAWRMLHDPRVVENLTTESYLELCLAAGYSKESSEKSACQWALRRLQRGESV